MDQRLEGEDEVSLLRQQRSCRKTQSARQPTTQHLSTREPKPSDATSNPISSCLSWCCTLCNADRLDSPEAELVHKLEPELQLEPETKSELGQEPSPVPKPAPVPPPELASGQEPRQHPSSIVNIPCQGLNEEICSTCNNKSGSHLSEVKFWLKGILEDLESRELKHLHWYLMNADELKDGLKPIRKYRLENADRLDTVDLMVDMYTTNTREVTEMILKKINCNKENPSLQDDPDAATVALQRCQDELKCNLKKRFECVFEGIPDEGNPNLLNDIYTELYITEGGTGEVNDEHEVRQIEAASRRPDRSETTIAHEDIFKPPPGRKGPIRTVMTKGVAGIGKTVLTQKFSLDWAEDKSNQDIQLIFPFTFRELNMFQDEKYSLVELVHEFFHETIEICNFEKFQVIFIFDGLDECRLPLDFRKTKILTDPRKSTSVDVLLKNLIMGKLLPSAHVWITTRPAAANQIPSDCIHLVTEVRGFTHPQKEEYFRKRFTDKEQSNRIISHIKTSQSLHIMCHIPVFCWITATVLESMMETREGRELPKSLTEMYIHFLVVHAKRKNVKYHERTESDPHWNLENKEMIESLGKVAFEQLQKGNLIFYESDLTECGIDIREASVYSGVFTQIFKKESRIHKYKVFCFIHLSVQEFLAALHVHLTFNNCGVNPLEEQKHTFRIYKTSEEGHLYQNAVDKALQSSNGHLDLFLRFLLGLSQLANETLLQGLLTPQARCAQTNQETVEYIKKKINKNLSAEKSINLFHCLNELNDRSLVKEIQQSLTSGNLSTEKLSPAQWSALVFILLSSEEDLEVFDLKKYCASEEALLRLLPVVKASKKAILRDCNLSKRSCEALSSILSSQSSGLTELDLSNNNLMDSGVKLLSSGLKSTSCKLESLRLTGCQITEKGCACLVSALKSNPSYLRELDLSYNHPGESGLKLLSAELEDPTTRLETLRVEPAGEIWLRSGLKKYFCQLIIDTNTANNKIQLSDGNRKMTRVEEDQLYPDHPDRFDESHQLLCRDGLTGRCYWEVEWTGRVDVSVCYRGIGRKGDQKYCVFGGNKQSWSLKCFDDDAGSCFAWHDDRKAFFSSSVSKRIAVYVDCPAGTLSFYRVSSFKRMHIYTFNTTFTEPLYPGFGFWPGSSVSLCSL